MQLKTADIRLDEAVSSYHRNRRFVMERFKIEGQEKGKVFVRAMGRQRRQIAA